MRNIWRKTSVISVLILLTLSGCSIGKTSNNTVPSAKTEPTISVHPSPPAADAGWINSTDGFFQVKLPQNYLDAYETVGGSDFPNAQVIISEPSNAGVEGYVSTVVIDTAQVVSDVDFVKAHLADDPSYPQMKNFKEEEKLKSGDNNALYMSWNYDREGTQMKIWICFIAGNDRSYAIKQEIPQSAVDQIPSVIPELVESWKWNPLPEQSEDNNSDQKN